MDHVKHLVDNIKLENLHSLDKLEIAVKNPV